MNTNKAMLVVFCLAGSSLWERRMKSAMWLVKLNAGTPCSLLFILSPCHVFQKSNGFYAYENETKVFFLKALD